MGVRAIEARLHCSREELKCLWRTHVVFNERLLPIIRILNRMYRGECGDYETTRELYRQIARFILARPARDAYYLLNSISIRNWTPNTAKKQRADVRQSDGSLLELTGDSWADAAAALSANGELLYDKAAVLGDIPEPLRQMVARECVAVISGHRELSAKWNSDHDEWLRRKAAWESEPDHRLYLELRSRFDSFESDAGGKVTKRRGRWHKYLDWLRANPDLAAWRGGQPVVNELSKEARARISSATMRRKRSVEAEEFWKANPELAALDKLHGFYEREFVRRRKLKKNQDGFDHRPTFTLPDAVRHPRWFVFNAPQTSPNGYRDLKLPSKPDGAGEIQLLLLTGDKETGKFPHSWIRLKFTADPRLADFFSVTEKQVIRKGKQKGEEQERLAFRFVDRQLDIERSAAISGAKLIFRKIKLNGDGSLQSAVPYLVFTCEVDDVATTELAREVKWVEAGPETKKKKPTIPQGLVTCAVDLGIRNVGFATVAALDPAAASTRILRSRNIWMAEKEKEGSHPGRWQAGPDLAHLAKHKREIRRLRRLRGKPVKGEESHIQLQEHITNMGDDRFKKAARAIVNFALNTDQRVSSLTGTNVPRADVLLVENLGGLLPDAERERGINKALVEFNRGHLVDRLKEVAKDAGLRVFTISPFGTSQVCSRCGVLGRRYSVRRDNETSRPDVVFGVVEALFACPSCGYRANSDHNASVNLHRKFLLGDKAVDAFLQYRLKPEKERELILRSIEGKLRGPLRRLHELDVEDLPF